MKKLIIVLFLLLVIMVSGCDAANPAWVNDNPPIEVNVVAGNVSMNGTISGNVSIINIPTVKIQDTPAVKVNVTNTITANITNKVTANVSGEVSLRDEYGFEAEFTPFDEVRTADTYKLAGTIFVGTTIDTNFVTVNTTGAGTVTQTGGQMLLQTNGINGYAEAFSNRRGRYIAGECNMAKLVMQIPDTGLANNKRRWGIGDLPGSGNYTITDGAYFQIEGTIFSVATLKGGVETLVSSGSFNGDIGTTYSLNTNVHVYEIYYAPDVVYFSLDGQLLHTVYATASTWTNTLNLYVGMDNKNSGGLANNRILYCRSFSISRLGQLRSAPVYRHISTATTTICKRGAGTLHSIILNNPTNNSITVYDNTAGSGTVIAIINPGSSTTPIELHYELDFYTGLTIVTAGTPDITVVYE